MNALHTTVANKPKMSVLVYAFVAVLLLDVILVLVKQENLRWFTKVLLMPLLITWTFRRRVSKWIIFALAFSWLGDIALLLPDFFLVGLICFAVVHVIYGIFFFRFFRVDAILANLAYVVVILVVSACYFLGIQDNLGKYLIPVLIYTLLISTMWILTVFSWRAEHVVASRYWVVGASLFALSDIALGLQLFKWSELPLGWFVILSYGCAQWCLSRGSIEFYSKQSSYHTFER